MVVILIAIPVSAKISPSIQQLAESALKEITQFQMLCSNLYVIEIVVDRTKAPDWCE